VSDEPLLHCEAIGKRYGELTALSDFSIRMEADEARIVALAGRSGSGKTTALQVALGLLRPTSGEVCYRGAPLRALPRGDRKRFRQQVQAVFDDPFAALNPFYRVGHVFEVMGRTLEIADARRATVEALEFVGLDPARTLTAFPHELSGGERQRVMIARALLPRPRLIVADEPLSLVDAPLRAAILGLVLDLRESGISFLYATHDLSTAYHVADELIVLHEGETVERGPARERIDAPRHARTRELIDSVPTLDVR
jgi:peptide/nickel transport system ATP-binding protein